MGARVSGLRVALDAAARVLAPYGVALVGLAVATLGAVGVVQSPSSIQGEGLLLFAGGTALVVVGLMMMLRWRLPAVRTGLAGITAGYFAMALSEFEVRTNPCDIGSTLAVCGGHVPGDTPWGVYHGPVILATCLFVFLVLEPLLPRDEAVATQT
jgi:hypothetical protein